LLPEGSIQDLTGYSHIAFVLLLYMIVWFAPNTQQIMIRFQPVLESVEAPRRYAPAWDFRVSSALAIGVAAGFGLLALGGTAEFLYFQF
jgi:hypothetical protein